MLEKANEKAIDMRIHDTMNDVISSEMKVYKETFSDLVAVELLQCCQTAYEEANCVSEGINVGADESLRREKILVRLGNKIGWTYKCSIELSRFDVLIYEYIEKCERHIKTVCEKSKTQECLTEIRKLYNCFAESNDTATCAQIYDSVLHCIAKLKETIDE